MSSILPTRFLFESLEPSPEAAVKYRILYTGDFRFDEVSLASLHSLHSSSAPSSEPIAIDEMYLDTTFCHPRYKSFPVRSEARNSIWTLVNGWVKKNGGWNRNQRAKHVVLFQLPGNFLSTPISAKHECRHSRLQLQLSMVPRPSSETFTSVPGPTGAST